MPRVGQEPARRAALLSATIHEIGKAGSLDVTVGQIAKQAGMSTALAHYYYASKDAIFLAAMRKILTDFGDVTRAELLNTTGPKARVDALIDVSLGQAQFTRELVSAWLVFYVQALHSPQAARLLRVYTRRLHSNLVAELRQLVPLTDARAISHGLGAMIDGIYIRQALGNGADPDAANKLLADYLSLALAAYSNKRN